MRNRFTFSVGVLVVALAASCVPTSTNPLSPVTEARHDPQLIGLWAGKPPDEHDDVVWVHFVEAEDSMTDIICVAAEREGADLMFYKMHPTTVGKNAYMNLKRGIPDNLIPDDKAEQLRKDLQAGNCILAKYEVSGDVLKIWTMTDKIGDAIQSGKLKGTVKKGKWLSNITITDSPEHMAKFLQTAEHAEIFDLLLVCKRVKPPSIPKASADGKREKGGQKER